MSTLVPPGKRNQRFGRDQPGLWPDRPMSADIGRGACARWLARNFDHIGVNSTVDLVATDL